METIAAAAPTEEIVSDPSPEEADMKAPTITDPAPINGDEQVDSAAAEDEQTPAETRTVEEQTGLPPGATYISAPPALTAENDDDDDGEDLFGDSDEDDDDDDDEEETSSAAPIETVASSPPPVANGGNDAAAAATSPPPDSSNNPIDEIVSEPKLASIPRKQPSTPTSAASPPAAAKTFSSPPSTTSTAASFGLPSTTKIPKSVTPQILNGKLLDLLKTLPVHMMNDALQEYDDAVDVKGYSSIRNHGAYLHGVVKRYVSVQERANSEGSNVLPMGESLTPTINERLEQLVSSGFCTRDEMNDKVKSKIRMLSEKDALFALDELRTVDRASIRNFGSYFMGILNRYMRGDVTSKARPSHHEQPSERHQQRGGRTKDRQYRDSASNFHPPDRDRSRDRYGNEGMRQPNPYGPPQPQAYDNRQNAYTQPPQPPQWQQMNQQAPPNNRSMMPGNQQGHMSGNYDNSYLPPLPAQAPPQQQQPYQMQMNSNSSNNPMFNSQGYPPQNLQQQQPPSSFDNNQTYYQNPQSMIGQSQQQHPPSQYGMQQMPPQMNQPPAVYSPPQQQPQTGYGASGPMMNSHQVGGGPGIVPGSYGPSSGAGPHGLPGSYNPPTGSNWQQQPPPQLDIMGLADKAASAVQALSSQRGMPQQHHQHHQPPPMMSNYGAPSMSQQPMPGQYQPYGGGAPSSGLPPMAHPGMQQPSYQTATGPPQMQQQGNDAFKRRTQARIEDLPPSVQYAVQNIQATGAVDGPLDPGILGMIFDLPEDLALGAIQRFSAIDRSAMRSKTAYLAGLLRRELEKINRR
ncbi:hypothetical protein MPSEU_000137700 [Mayamaea pseudoterrestris]|nr:hypothetical protein MPSEU_000137700 [Mayamaea pseudoterrestris]